jgi:hypothetical protein
MIEMKAFLYILLTNFTFAETGEKIFKANVCVSPSLISNGYLSPRALQLLMILCFQGFDPAICFRQIQRGESMPFVCQALRQARLDFHTEAAVPPALFSSI